MLSSDDFADTDALTDRSTATDVNEGDSSEVPHAKEEPQSKNNSSELQDENDAKESLTNDEPVTLREYSHYDESSIVGSDDAPYHVVLPKKESNGNPQTVSGTCCICLCHYEAGETIVWSSNMKCPHAFHEDCILTWLVKKNEALCPFCRQGKIDLYCAEVIIFY